MSSFFQREMTAQNNLVSKLEVLDTYQVLEDVRQQLIQRVKRQLRGLSVSQLLDAYVRLPGIVDTRDQTLHFAVLNLFDHSHIYGKFADELTEIHHKCTMKEEMVHKKYMAIPRQTARRTVDHSARNFE